ncbi:MAG: hybrid sensor histidine kinase/response regulator [Gammaproteobacteria bacterium]|nr:MAG: hybrid sensor histidine kinase/response regulator [Gammaproteobacteria bacterium]
MFPNWQLVLLSFSYIGLLFLIAYLGDKYRSKIFKRSQTIIYALTLGVYCTSWSFLGTSGKADTNVLAHLPIYLGPILLFVFAWPFIQRIIRVSLKLHLTSIADLLAARFGKSHNLAILVTIVALIGIMPYLALQIKAIVYSFQQLQAQQNFVTWQLGLAVSLVLAGFTIVFGIRTIDVTERHPGVMLAIAFESLVKLIAFISVALFVTFFLYDSPVDLWQQADQKIDFASQFNWSNVISMLSLLVITMTAFLSLPRQFQVMVVELKDTKQTWLSRRIFPLYLLAFVLGTIPLSLAGYLLLNNHVAPDAYVLFLPWQGKQVWLTLFTFLGAISAASSMVIISAIALSTMLSNEIVFPLLFRSVKQQDNYDNFRIQLLNTRKVLVLLVVMLGYLVFLMASPDTLSSLGEISFGAIAQLTPALLVAFYWRRASLKGVFSGIFIGFSLWFLLNFLPQIGLYSHPLILDVMPANSVATLVSLVANILTMWAISQLSRQSVQERVQASLFLEWRAPQQVTSPKTRQINLTELQLLASRFVGEQKAKLSFEQFILTSEKSTLTSKEYKQALLEHTENTLAKVMGSSSARLVLSSALEGRDIALDELAVLVEEASTQKQQFGHNLLQSAIENASEGMSIIDENLNLVAWNKKYLALFNYPSELVYVGCPIETLIRFNAQRGLCGAGEVEAQVAKRISYLKQGSPHSSERQHHNGQVIRIEGNPLPDGGFVMMFTDITAYKEAELILKEANQDLATSVLERTQKLAQANQELALAREKAEQAHLKKSQYLKACSHDLMQPLEAARLFTSALSTQDDLNEVQQRQVENINNSLKVANELLFNLGEIARIEGGNITPNLEDFSLNELFSSLAQEFSAAADELNVDFRVMPTKQWVTSDKHLLRRILQNLLGNAFRYASPGKVLLGVRKVNGQLQIQVLDNGPGIPQDKQTIVFEQFTQLDNVSNASGQGLGLGLNITQSLAGILAHTLSLTSREHQGCKFSILLPKAQAQPLARQVVIRPKVSLQGATVLCIDNDTAVLNGMIALLTAWQCQVYGAESFEKALSVFNDHQNEIDILLVDYQLDNNQNGLNLITKIRYQTNNVIPAILITATTDSDIEGKTQRANVGFMRKLVKPAALRAMMSAMLAKHLQDNYLE